MLFQADRAHHVTACTHPMEITSIRLHFSEDQYLLFSSLLELFLFFARIPARAVGAWVLRKAVVGMQHGCRRKSNRPTLPRPWFLRATSTAIRHKRTSFILNTLPLLGRKVRDEAWHVGEVKYERC